MSSFGSSAINKSGKKPVPKAARRRPGAATESLPQSQPATPALSAISVASSEEPPATSLTSQAHVVDSQHVAESSLITHAANESSQAARDEAEVHQQHRSEVLERQAEEHEAREAQESVDTAGPSAGNAGTVTHSANEVANPESVVVATGPLRESRVEVGGHNATPTQTSSETAQLEQPYVQQQLIDETNRTPSRAQSVDNIFRGARAASASAPFGIPANAIPVHREASKEAGPSSAGAGSAAPSSKRKRATGIKSFQNKRRHLQTSGEITLESLQNEVQQSIEQPEVTETIEQPQPSKKPRKIRKDKGIPRKKKTDQPITNNENVDSTTPAVTPATTRELRERPTPSSRAPADTDMTDAAADEEVEEGSTPRRKRRKPRAVTPEENQAITINPSEAQMADMLADRKIGQVSSLEKRMRDIDWKEVAAKRKAARQPPPEGETAEPLHSNGEDGDQAAADADHADEDEGAEIGPVTQRVRLVNGVITVMDETAHISRHAEADAELSTLEVVEHEDLTERINSTSWIDVNRRDPIERKYGRAKSDPWSLRDTDKFYEALRMLGTDFFVLAKVFKGKTRRQVKSKFVREERDDPDRVKRALLTERKPLDIEIFKEWTGITNLRSPDEINQGLAEDRAEREQEVAQAREDFAETARQKRVMEQMGGSGENGESAKENEAPGAKGKKRPKKSKKGLVETADQTAEVVETMEEG